MKTFISDAEMIQLEKQGIAKSPDFISDAEMLQMESPVKENTFSNNWEDIKSERVGKLQEIADVTSAGKQSFAHGAFQTGGQLVGAAFDPFVAGIKTYTPEVIKKGVGAAFSPISKGIAHVSDVISNIPSLQKFAMTDQSKVLERDIEALNEYLVLLAPESKGVSKTISKLAVESGEVAEKSALKSMTSIKSNFVEKLVSPEKTKAVKLAEVARTTETGSGMFKKSVVAPTNAEKKAIEEVMKIPEVSPSNTLQQNYNIISKANTQAAKQLKKDILANDFIYPKKELLSRLNQSKVKLSESPLIVGDAVKTANKMLAKVEQLISERPSLGSELLEIRKDYDFWIKSQKGAGIFDPARESSMSIANREIRQTLNKFLDDKATNVLVSESRAKQSALFDALENIAPKAAKEADTAVLRAFQQMESILGVKNKLVQMIAALTAVGGLGAAATYAPLALGVGLSTFVMYQGGKLVLKPQFRLLLGEALKVAGNTLSAEEKRVIQSLLATKAVMELNAEIQ